MMGEVDISLMQLFNGDSHIVQYAGQQKAPCKETNKGFTGAAATNSEASD